ncbi:MAG: hypothetical protein KDE46_18790, partial [Caldilineaceae bacterium]|nr:hypothetical protein [Caldilineaceae bacterium]
NTGLVVGILAAMLYEHFPQTLSTFALTQFSSKNRLQSDIHCPWRCASCMDETFLHEIFQYGIYCMNISEEAKMPIEDRVEYNL